MIRYGKVIRVVVPRPPLYGEPSNMPGYGNCYVRFREVDEAKQAKVSLIRRRFNGRAADVQYYPEDKFVKCIWA